MVILKLKPEFEWQDGLKPYFAEGWPPCPSVSYGWKNLITKLISDLNKLNVPWKAIQIKEKFGTLRFYASIQYITNDWRIKVSDPNYKLSKYDKQLFKFYHKSKEEQNKLKRQFDKLVDIAESRSAHICELCGKNGSTRYHIAHIQTLCNKCMRKLEHGK